MKKNTPFIILVSIILCLKFIGEFLFKMADPNISFAQNLSIIEIIQIWSISGWIAFFIIVTVCVVACVKQSSGMIIVNLFLLMGVVYIQTLMICQAPPGCKIGLRLTAIWCVAWLAFISVLINGIAYAYILFVNYKKRQRAQKFCEKSIE